MSGNHSSELESLLAAPQAVEVPAQFADKVMLRVELEPRMRQPWQLPSECIAPVVLTAVGIGFLAMQWSGGGFAIEGRTGLQWYAVAAALLVGFVPLWSGLRAVAQG